MFRLFSDCHSYISYRYHGSMGKDTLSFRTLRDSCELSMLSGLATHHFCLESRGGDQTYLIYLWNSSPEVFSEEHLALICFEDSIFPITFVFIGKCSRCSSIRSGLIQCCQKLTSAQSTGADLFFPYEAADLHYGISGCRAHRHRQSPIHADLLKHAIAYQ